MARREDPWFWDDGVPHDEFVLACEISNRGCITAHVRRLMKLSYGVDKEPLIGEMSHSEIIDFVRRYARGPSKRLRSGK